MPAVKVLGRSGHSKCSDIGLECGLYWSPQLDPLEQNHCAPWLLSQEGLMKGRKAGGT